MDNQKIDTNDSQDFIHVMNNIISAYKETTKTLCEADNISATHQEKIEAEIDSWVRDLIKIAGENVTVQGKDIKIDSLLNEKDDENLAKEEKQLELKAREALSTLIHKRKNASNEIMPMLEEIEKIKSHALDNITFEQPTEDTKLVDKMPDTKEMESEYEDSMKLLSELQKNIPITKEKLQQYQNLLKTNKN
ncbi:hypothetical protein BJ944DRAFT_269702 [Cunninghamella echinulata]|nr:hypothetical protein BJ944DRAFT_269702 [Cunninghamella echinulata]